MIYEIYVNAKKVTRFTTTTDCGTHQRDVIIVFESLKAMGVNPQMTAHADIEKGIEYYRVYIIG